MSEKHLNLPPFDYRIRRQNGQPQLFDPIRKRYVALTPEEWVRQHLIHYLVDHLQYPAALMAVEKEIAVGALRRRFDLVCYDRQIRPFLLVECKAPEVALCQETFDQVFQYNSAVGARYVAISNGCHHLCGEVIPGAGFRLIAGFPVFSG